MAEKLTAAVPALKAAIEEARGSTTITARPAMEPELVQQKAAAAISHVRELPLQHALEIGLELVARLEREATN